MATDHEPRLSTALRHLLHRQRVAALGTLQPDGAPLATMVPYAIDCAAACLVLHVSALAPHTPNLLRDGRVSLLVMQPEEHGVPVHALPRVSLEGRAEPVAMHTVEWEQARAAYLARFPEAEPMTELGDFRFVRIHLQGARQVAGFGAARALQAEDLQALLRRPPSSEPEEVPRAAT